MIRIEFNECLSVLHFEYLLSYLVPEKLLKDKFSSDCLPSSPTSPLPVLLTRCGINRTFLYSEKKDTAILCHILLQKASQTYTTMWIT